MTVAELIAKLQDMPQDLPVTIDDGVGDYPIATGSVQLEMGRYWTPRHRRTGESVCIDIGSDTSDPMP